MFFCMFFGKSPIRLSTFLQMVEKYTLSNSALYGSIRDFSFGCVSWNHPSSPSLCSSLALSRGFLFCSSSRLLLVFNLPAVHCLGMSAGITNCLSLFRGGITKCRTDVGKFSCSYKSSALVRTEKYCASLQIAFQLSVLHVCAITTSLSAIMDCSVS